MSQNALAALAALPSLPDEWAAAPFDAALVADIRALVARLDSPQRLWLSGYLAGLSDRSAPLHAVPAAAAPSSAAATILFGSQSGNCERLARRLGDTLAARGLAVTVLDMVDCRKSHLTEARTLLVIVSTHGEGDPPDRARPLHELLHSRKAPSLKHLKYAVLALGDSSYERFCETGRQFDARLAALGAEALHARVDCDVDFEAAAEEWITAVSDKLAQSNAPNAPRVAASAVSRPAAVLSSAYTRKNPYAASVLTNQRLTARDSTKDVRHIELALGDSGIRYEPGDAIGIVPRNREEDVDELLAALKLDADAAVTVDSQPVPLRQALLTHYDIGPLTRGAIERYAAATPAPALKRLLGEEHRPELLEYLRGRHFIDLVLDFPPAGLDAPALAAVLRPLAPRLYSIASSQRATPDEAHLTVSLVEYAFRGRRRRGTVSGFLADLDGEEATAPIYLHRNPNFRLPASGDAPVIMIGPGTGVAPFRGFLAEREAAGASGRSWLFFGDRTFASDFLYQAEWLEWRKAGVLTRIDVAFSRDQKDKLYVQHRMREHGREIWSWLQDGAHLYVCGDAQQMAPDVHRALLDIACLHGGHSEEQASEYLVDLQRERRYQRDVY